MALKWPKMHEIIRFFDKKCILVRVFRKQIRNLVEVNKMVAATRFSLKIPSTVEKSLINQDFEKSLKVYTNRQKMVQMT